MPVTTPVQTDNVAAKRRGAAILKIFRQVHLYIGVFAAPALLFFAFTGALQTFSLHQAARTGDYKPPHWVMVLAQIHKNQTATLPVRRPEPGAAAKPTSATTPSSAAKPVSDTPAATPQTSGLTASGRPAGSEAAAHGPVAAPGNAPGTPAGKPQDSGPNRLPLKIFFALISLSFLSSIVSGVFMAYKYNRGKWVVTGLLVAGVIVPLALLFV